jgi:hypothetical protein
MKDGAARAVAEAVAEERLTPDQVAAARTTTRCPAGTLLGVPHGHRYIGAYGPPDGAVGQVAVEGAVASWRAGLGIPAMQG